MSTITYDYEEILQRLSEPFPADQVKVFPMQTTKKADKNGKWRGMAAFYVDARAVQQRLDDTCVWEDVISEDPRNANLGMDKHPAILSGIRILIERKDGLLEWITRWDGADNTDIEATKGGLSSALRRAAVKFGVGRYLYDVPNEWHEMKPPPEGRRPQYWVSTPRIPAKFQPKGEASRAKAAKTERPAPAPATDEAPAEEAKPEGTKLSAAQVKRISNASKNKDRNAVRPIYSAIVKGDLKLADGLKRIKELPDLEQEAPNTTETA